MSALNEWRVTVGDWLLLGLFDCAVSETGGD